MSMFRNWGMKSLAVLVSSAAWAAPLKLPKYCQLPADIAEAEAHAKQAADNLAWVILHKTDVQKKLVEGDLSAQVDTKQVEKMLASCAEQYSQGKSKCDVIDTRKELKLLRPLQTVGRWSNNGMYAGPALLFSAAGFAGIMGSVIGFASTHGAEFSGWIGGALGVAFIGLDFALDHGEIACNLSRIQALEKLNGKKWQQILDDHFYAKLQENGISVPKQNREKWLEDQMRGIQEIPVHAYEGEAGINEEIKTLKLWLSREITQQRELKHEATAQMLEELQAKVPNNVHGWKFWERPKQLQENLAKVVELKNDILQLERDSGLSKKGVHLMDLIISQSEIKGAESLERRQRLWKMMGPLKAIRTQLQIHPLNEDIESKLLKLAEEGWKLDVDSHVSVPSTKVSGVVDVNFKFYHPDNPEKQILIPLELPHATHLSKEYVDAEKTLTTKFDMLIPQLNEALEDELKFVELSEKTAQIPATPESYKLKLPNSPEGCKLSIRRSLGSRIKN